MEPLEFPDAIPPRGENHYLGWYVAIFDDEGKLAEIIWVRYHRNLMFEIPANCPVESAHWFQVFNQQNDMVIGSLPTPGMRRSVMFPGDTFSLSEQTNVRRLAQPYNLYQALRANQSIFVCSKNKIGIKSPP